MKISQWNGVAAVALVAIVVALAGCTHDLLAGVTLAVAGGIVISDRMEQLKATLQDLADKTNAIQAKAIAANRDLTADEHQAVTGLADEFDRVEAELQLAERTAAMQNRAGAGTGRRTDPSQPGTGEPMARGQNANGLQSTTLRTQSERDRAGFTNLGEFARSVMDFQRGTRQDPRLIQMAAASTFGTEGIGADGGFAVPVEWRSQIQSLVMGEDSLLSRCDAQPTNSNVVMVPTDEDTAWGTSGGVQVYRRAEAGTMTQSKPAMREITVRVEELYALVPVSDGLLNDAPMLATWLGRKAGEKINFKINDELINGTGAAGQMLGILNAPCTVSVAKETGQAAATLVATNVLKMYSRMPDAVRRNAVWLINQDIEPQLLNINLAFQNAVGSAGIAAGVSGLVGEGGLRFDQTQGTLMGRPIIATEACATLGTVGDIILAYLPGYFAPYAAGGLREAMSMHLWFDQGLTAFRWTFRVGGQPWLGAALSRKNGSNTLSHFVTLATRA